MKRVIGIHNELVITGNSCVSPDLPRDTVIFSDGQCFYDPPFEHRAQGPGIFIDLAGIEFSPVVRSDEQPVEIRLAEATAGAQIAKLDQAIFGARIVGRNVRGRGVRC